MAASFDIAYNISAHHEAGYSKNPNDDGNWTGGRVGTGVLVGTNWGIAAPTYASYLKRTPTEADMRAMTAATAKAIFKANFWDRPGFGGIRDQQVANIVYDAYINQSRGTGWMIRKALGDNIPLQLDMNVSSQIARINAMPGTNFFNNFKVQREWYYRHQNNPTFINGWLNRLNSFVYSGAQAARQAAAYASNNTGLMIALGLVIAIALIVIYLEVIEKKSVTKLILSYTN